MMAFMGYYGHTHNMVNLHETNIYLSYFLGALVEVPCWSVPFIIRQMGCRWPLLFFFLVSGTCGVTYGALPREWPLLRLASGLVAKLAVTGAYYICQQYSSEIFPTVVRGQGVRGIDKYFLTKPAWHV